jgi:hypothetical protein
VKQCEHCRTARKSKSHHAKCDCGNKKTKKETKPEVKGELCRGRLSTCFEYHTDRHLQRKLYAFATRPQYVIVETKPRVQRPVSKRLCSALRIPSRASRV